MADVGNDQTAFHHALVDAHGNYRSQRLTHSPPDELISDVVTMRTLRPHIARSGFFFALLVLLSMASFFTWIAAVVAALGSSNSLTGEFSAGATALVAVSYLLLLLLFVVLLAWIVALFLPLREPIAEYGLLIEGRGPAYATAYWWITNTMQNRRSPFRAGVGRVGELPVLHMASGRVKGMVMVRPVGTDLYVGWTMWRERSTLIMIGHLIRDMFQSPLHADVRAASSRALRELIHSVTREGVQAAILQPPVSEEAARAQIEGLPSLDTPAGPVVVNAPQFQPPTQPTPENGPRLRDGAPGP